MARVRKFMGLPPSTQLLLLKTISVVTLVRLSLWLLPFKTIRAYRDRMLKRTGHADVRDLAAVRQTVWAVTVTSRYVPEASCLTQALAAQILLGQQGYRTDLRIGVSKGEANQPLAHAWVELDGRVVIGGTDSPKRYAAFSSLERKGP
jgi:hypothetical protein